MAGKRIQDNRAADWGIGEWFGKAFDSLSPLERLELVDYSQKSVNQKIWDTDPTWPPCLPRGGRVPCTKQGGVCSLVRYQRAIDGAITKDPVLATACPNRFEEAGAVHSLVAKELIGVDDPIRIGQVQFLIPVRAEEHEEAGEKESVGRIDDILVDPDSFPLRWCAMEIQAVYHSGDSWDREFEGVEGTEGLYGNWPFGRRHPDFRSSSAKRLLPQLQIKVPTLRRWGKKMGVVVDEAFFRTLAPMTTETNSSNADIAWFVMRYRWDAQVGAWVVNLEAPRYTTLEAAVDGLTAGRPVALETFETRIRDAVFRRHRIHLPGAPSG